MFDVSDAQKSVRAWAREFAEREVAPRAAAMDAAGEFPRELVGLMFDAGLMGMLVPAAHGGRGARTLEYATAVEELARADASTALVMCIHSSLVTALLAEFASDAIKARWLGRLATRSVGAFALTEDDPSSPTRAEERDGGFVVTGSKSYITNGPIADVVLVFAVTGRIETEKDGKRVSRDEVSAFLVDGGATGLSRSSVGPKLGLSAAPVGRLRFDGVRVPADRMVGGRGAGFAMAMKALDGGRIAAAAMGVGIAQAALDGAKAYAKARVTQGQPIAKHQAVQFMIAEAATRLEAARALAYHAALAADRGDAAVTELAAQAKLFASEAASFAASRCLQVHGGAGVVRGLHAAERCFRDARVLEIIEGTSEIQKLVVAGHELRR
ncbi:MAG: acyl-CoA dehydrogenase family protein [Candidatus Eisenbacteria bacterium]|nr:acyl-CoA dehydrogenase family protein [Candidatus Eisenbacteria bacterium]